MGSRPNWKHLGTLIMLCCKRSELMLGHPTVVLTASSPTQVQPHWSHEKGIQTSNLFMALTLKHQTCKLLSEDSSTSECDRAAVAQQDRQLVQAWNDGKQRSKIVKPLTTGEDETFDFQHGGYTRQFSLLISKQPYRNIYLSLKSLCWWNVQDQSSFMTQKMVKYHL